MKTYTIKIQAEGISHYQTIFDDNDYKILMEVLEKIRRNASPLSDVPSPDNTARTAEGIKTPFGELSYSEEENCLHHNPSLNSKDWNEVEVLLFKLASQFKSQDSKEVEESSKYRCSGCGWPHHPTANYCDECSLPINPNSK